VDCTMFIVFKFQLIPAPRLRGAAGR